MSLKLRYSTEIDDGKQPFSLFEEKTISLVETRGIASYDSRQIIDKIIEYINYYIEVINHYITYHNEYYNDYDGEHYVKISDYITIKIPTELTGQFKEFDKLELIIYVKNIIGKVSPVKHITDSEGKNSLAINNGIKDNKLKFAKITIYCSSINNKIIESDFYEAFTHEFNHTYEEYYRKLNNVVNNKVRDSLNNFYHINMREKHKLLDSDNIIEQSFGWVLYTLWSKHEFNAWVTSSYSYLKGINSERNYFSLDIKNCEAYEVYQQIKNNFIPEIKKCEDITMWIHVNNIVSKNKISIDNITQETILKISNFKNRFINKSEKLLDKFWIKLCRTAALWYDEKENKN